MTEEQFKLLLNFAKHVGKVCAEYDQLVEALGVSKEQLIKLNLEYNKGYREHAA